MDKRMDKGMRVRWTILLLAVAATAAASFYPTEDNSLLNSARAGKRSASSATATAATSETPVAETQADDAPDPFAPRGWQPPPPPAPEPVKPMAVVAAPVAPSAPAGPPPLPFKFMGAMNDDGQQVIYLSRGDQAFVARPGETLDGAYKVLAVDSQHIEFEHLASGEKQTLAIPASDN